MKKSKLKILTAVIAGLVSTASLAGSDIPGNVKKKKKKKGAYAPVFELIRSGLQCLEHFLAN
ncbi:MAG: hypothetical protein KDD50_13765, partial [Bdellovibrionales bacterium]|nr:hypothetical protein [Bdellovibrionales bacterium]